jgi:fructuronate reductase
MLEEGKEPIMLALTVSVWLACIAPLPGFNPGPITHEIADPARKKIAAIANESSSVPSLRH